MRLRAPARNVRSRVAFTLIEVLMAIGIFGMVMVAIYASWSSILRGSRIGLKAAAEVQRTRMTIRALEDSLGSAIMYADNIKHYWILADTAGDFGSISFVARLPESFPGGGLFPGQPLRRVTFTVDGSRTLKLMQTPILEATDLVSQPYTIRLAPDVSLFKMEFLDLRAREWLTEWPHTNQLPRMVRVAIGFADKKQYAAKTEDMTIRVIGLSATPIMRIGGSGPAGQQQARPGVVNPPRR